MASWQCMKTIVTVTITIEPELMSLYVYDHMINRHTWNTLC